MKKIISVLIIMLLTMTTVTVFASSEAVIYVSVNGSDTSGNGSLGAPFATVNAAMEKIRTMTKTASVDVVIQEGIYSAEKQMAFVATDSGNESCKITYRAEGDVVITGGITVDNNDFKKVSDPEILVKLRKEVRGKIYELSLNDYGLSDLKRTKLFIDDKKQTEARYPNSGYITVSNEENDSTVLCSDERAAFWQNASDAYIAGSLGATYFWAETAIRKIDSSGNMTLGSDVRNNAEIFVTNLTEEIDTVGEYSVDSSRGMLYCYLPDDYLDKKIEIISNKLKNTLITLTNVSDLSFEGITFDKIPTGVFVMTNSKNISVTNCNFRYIQADYTIISSSGQNVLISSNTAYGTSGGFIAFSGGDRSTLTPGNNIVSDNLITNCGDKLSFINFMIGGGANSESAVADCIGNKILNNVIGNCSSVYAISFPGNNNEIKYNEIYNVGRQISDGGAMYFGRSVTKYGNEVAYNYIHHLNKNNMYAGFYADDGYSGINFHHNVMYNMFHPIHLGLGMDVKINNNISVDTVNGIKSGTRMTWGYQKGSNIYYEMERLMSDSNLKALFEREYPLLKGALARTPFFAPYNSEITGNVLFGTRYSFSEIASHNYKYNGSLVIEGEDKVSRIDDAMKSANVVNEIKAYGAVITNSSGADINGTDAGNPSFYSYDSSVFSDYENQNFNLTDSLTGQTKYINSNSTANLIDMDEIGISDTALFTKDSQINVRASYSDNKLIVSWDRPENASLYNITVTDNNGYSDTKSIYDNNLEASVEFSGLTEGQTYYITINTKELARQNISSLSSESLSFTIPYSNDNSSLVYAISLLDDRIKYYEAYGYENQIYEQMKSLSASLKAATPTDETEIELAENSIYTLLVSSRNEIYEQDCRITNCEALDYSSKVNVTAVGFEPYSLVTVLVTNPGSALENLSQENKSIVRYTNIAKADSLGSVTFNFDTKIKDIDMPGEYNVYIAGSDGKTASGSYIYGTVETSDVTFKVKNGLVDDTTGESTDLTVNAEDLYLYVGKDVQISLDISSRLSENIQPEVVLGIYGLSERLLDVFTHNSTLLEKNSAETLSVTIKIPDNYDRNSRIEIMILDSLMLLKPLTVKRIITSKN